MAKGTKIPFRFTLRDGAPFAFAGIGEAFERPDGRSVPTFAIITTAADRVMAPIHQRMPVILTPETERLWLSPTDEKADLLKMLETGGPERLRAFEVSRLVNRASVDSLEVIRPVVASEAAA